jgi:hypothetical protein
MTGSTPRFLAALIAAAVVLAGCGGGGSHAAGGQGAATTTTTTSAPPPVSQADPVTLLPTAGEVSTLIKPASRPTRYDERLNSSTVSSAFSSQVPASQRLASGAAELDVAGRKGAFLYAHVFEFKSLSGAKSLTATFLSATRLRNAQPRPSAAPGQLGAASSQPYGHGQVSYRYAFQEHNVLSYVELDGPRGKFSLADAIRVATTADQHIKATLR